MTADTRRQRLDLKQLDPDSADTAKHRAGIAGGLPSIDCGALSESVSFFVQCAHRAIAHQWTGHFGELGLRHIYYSAFVLIGANPGLSLVEMARFLSLDKSRASELMRWSRLSIWCGAVSAGIIGVRVST